MKDERLFQAIEKIDDDLILNAVNDVKSKKKGIWLKWGAVAACLCLIVAVAILVSDIFIPTPENIQYADAKDVGDSPEDNPDRYSAAQGQQISDDAEIAEQDKKEQAQGPLIWTGTPDNEAFDPSTIRPMISSYGSMASSASYQSPDNGACRYSIPLREAMEEYGDTVLYCVVVDVFSDNQMLEANSEAVKNERERLAELKYTVALETYYDGTMNHYYFSLHATQEQLTNFLQNDNYGYMFWLYDERVIGNF